jgi:manganese/zinc/iron transport system permease protein
MIRWEWGYDGWVLVAGVLSAVSCALPGNYLVLRRMSLMGDAISHAVLPGLAIAFLLTASRAPLPMFLGAVAVGVLTALFTQVLTHHGKVEHGAAMGVVFSILFAVGLVLIQQVGNIDLDANCVLYGSLESIGLIGATEGLPPQVVNLGLALLLNVLFIAVLYKELKICAFDPELATTQGINANLIHYLLMIVVAITTVANFEAVGSILVIAMLIAPAAAAHLLTDRLSVMILLSAVIATVSALVGYPAAIVLPGWLGYPEDLALNAAASIAVFAGAGYAIALTCSPKYGLLARVAHRAAVSVQIVSEDILGLLYRWQERMAAGGRAMRQREVLAAVGNSILARGALWWLARRGHITTRADNGQTALTLAPSGHERAVRVVRAHRLWEAYLDRHFAIPADHLHAPAERVEHFITPAMREELAQDLAGQERDPHGKPIPDAKTEP